MEIKHGRDNLPGIYSRLQNGRIQSTLHVEHISGNYDRGLRLMNRWHQDLTDELNIMY